MLEHHLHIASLHFLPITCIATYLDLRVNVLFVFQLQQFLSDVGGAIGLWIGLSVLSLCELVQLFVELCDYGIHKTVKERRKERKKRKKEQKRIAAARNQSLSRNNQHVWPNTNFENEQNNIRSGLYSFSILQRDFGRPYPGSDVVSNSYNEEDDGYRYYSSDR